MHSLPEILGSWQMHLRGRRFENLKTKNVCEDPKTSLESIQEVGGPAELSHVP